jgi:cyanophycin synthetase
MPVPIISITGTKGKTTTTFVVSQVLQALGKDVLRVDTTGHYLNGVQRSTLEDSKQVWGLVPSVSPGRFLWEFQVNPGLRENGVAVLESSLGSSSLSGMGYRSHAVGVFLNVFEDHLGSSDRLKTKADIAMAKSFIFSRLERDGWVVCNADDPLVTGTLGVVPEHLDITILPCGIEFSHFDLPGHLSAGGAAVTVKDGKAVLLKNDSEEVLFDLTAIPWTFNVTFMPSVWNCLMAASAVYAARGGEWTPDVRQAFEAVRLDNYGGRLTLLQAANGATILTDYAHEKVSLVEVAKLARTLVKPGGKVIGILRLANDRTDELIQETGRAVGACYDECIVFDKIDGYLRQPRKVRSQRFPEVVGTVSETYAAAIKEVNPHVERIIREDQAVAHAASVATANDVVVYIVNDDVKRSIGFAKEYFQAEFI